MTLHTPFGQSFKELRIQHNKVARLIPFPYTWIHVEMGVIAAPEDEALRQLLNEVQFELSDESFEALNRAAKDANQNIDASQQAFKKWLTDLGGAEWAEESYAQTLLPKDARPLMI